MSTIVDVVRDANAVVQTAYLQPTADLDKLEWVLVITDYAGGLPDLTSGTGSGGALPLDGGGTGDPGGSGEAYSAHGKIPVPGPATLALMRGAPDAHPAALDEIGGSLATMYGRQLLPVVGGHDGFYYALLRKDR